MSDIPQQSSQPSAHRTGHLAWRAAGIGSLALSALVQVWLSHRLGTPEPQTAVLVDYLAIMVSFVLAVVGIALIVLGRDALPLLRNRD